MVATQSDPEPVVIAATVVEATCVQGEKVATPEDSAMQLELKRQQRVAEREEARRLQRERDAKENPCGEAMSGQCCGGFLLAVCFMGAVGGLSPIGE